MISKNNEFSASTPASEMRRRPRVHVCARASEERGDATASASSSLSETQFASIVAGLSTRLAVHPVDSVKTRLQRIRGRRGAFHGMAALHRQLQTEGIGSLYRGILGALVGVLPYSMLYMPSYELSQQVLLLLRFPDGARDGAAGAMAGLAGSVVKVPVDVMKKRTQAGLDKNFMEAMARFGAPGLIGVKRMYAGWGAAVMYSMPYNAVQFALLEQVKRSMRSLREPAPPVPAEHVAVGAITGVLTSLATEPMDVIKTRMMTQRLADGTMYRNWAHCAKIMLREEGVTAFWKGTAPRLVLVSASSALWYGTYQILKRALARRRISRSAASASSIKTL